jgi:hypothetical protein
MLEPLFNPQCDEVRRLEALATAPPQMQMCPIRSFSSAVNLRSSRRRCMQPTEDRAFRPYGRL